MCPQCAQRSVVPLPFTGALTAGEAGEGDLYVAVGALLAVPRGAKRRQLNMQPPSCEARTQALAYRTAAVLVAALKD
jgi:hypothetical protein